MELSLDQALKKGIEAHKIGKAQEADRYYTAILNANPRHPDANHNMGVLAVDVGKVKEALPFFKTALEINPSIAQYWLSYIDALIKLDRIVDAKAVFDQATSKGVKGDSFNKLALKLSKSSQLNTNQNNQDIADKAIELRENGKYQEAITLLQNSIKKSPKDPNIAAILSHCYILNDNLKEAIIYLEKAKSINPGIASVGWNEARVLLQQNKVIEALNIAKKTNKLFPNDVEGLVVLGSCLRLQGDIKNSINILNRAIELNPTNAEACINRGLIRLKKGDNLNALQDLEKAHRLKPFIKNIWQLILSLKMKFQQFEDMNTIALKMAELDPYDEKILASLAVSYQNLQRFNEAEKAYKQVINIKYDYLEAWVNLGANLYMQGKLDEAVKAYKKALSINPNYAIAYNNMGNALKQLGKLKEALAAYKKALSINPDYSEAYYNIGNATQEQGKLDEAVKAYKKALSINPNYAAAYNNMGKALNQLGKLKEAITAYKKALSINPENAETYCNLGNVIHRQGDFEKAIAAYRKAIYLNPKHVEARYNMGNAFMQQGEIGKAIAAYNKVLSLNPNYDEAYYKLGLALNGVSFKRPVSDLQKKIISLLDRKIYVRPKDIATSSISLLKLEPDLQKHLKMVDTEVIESPLDVILDLSEFPLLLKLMSVCPLPDLELEELLTKLRYSILSNTASLQVSSPKLLNFQSALALQCFTNEYIYSHSEEEEKILQSLDASVKKALKNNKQPSSQAILALASYKALNQYDWCNLLVATDNIKEVFCRQVEEPNQDEKLKQDLATLEEISDKVSSKVREQYEGNPYPRWVNLSLQLKSRPISEIVDGIQLKLFCNKINQTEEPNLLIAGCGTGQHSISTAVRFSRSKVLAVDLSLSSLAYAKRKTKELGIQNIEYMQADILDLNKLNRQYDIIESAGVLHHMDNPLSGWEVLTQCLLPGGLMKVGLYSELARQHIVKIRKEISKQGIGSSEVEIKAFRDRILSSDKDHHKLVRKSGDFYSTSTLKDLIFHVQEYRFTIPQIKDCLSKLGLKFCGFEGKMVREFKINNTKRGDEYNLDKWQEYEEANPNTFTGMYQFWCQKVG